MYPDDGILKTRFAKRGFEKPQQARRSRDGPEVVKDERENRRPAIGSHGFDNPAHSADALRIENVVEVKVAVLVDPAPFAIGLIGGDPHVTTRRLRRFDRGEGDQTPPMLHVENGVKSPGRLLRRQLDPVQKCLRRGESAILRAGDMIGRSLIVGLVVSLAWQRSYPVGCSRPCCHRSGRLSSANAGLLRYDLHS